MDEGFVTEEQEHRQRTCVSLLAHRWCYEVHDYPRFSPIDGYYHANGKHKCVFEHKDRSSWRERMGALWLPHRKADVLVRYAQIFDCGAIFIYQLYDSYAWCDVKQIMAHCPLITAGRNEARDGSGPHEQQEEVFLVCEEYLNRLEMRP